MPQMKKYLPKVLFVLMFFGHEALSTQSSTPSHPSRPNFVKRLWVRIFPKSPSTRYLEPQERRSIALAQGRSLDTEAQRIQLLTDKQIDAILKLYDKDKMDGLDPARPGEDYSKAEKSMAITITQIAPNCEGGYLAALDLVFSEKRSRKIFKSILSSNED